MNTPPVAIVAAPTSYVYQPNMGISEPKPLAIDNICVGQLPDGSIGFIGDLHGAGSIGVGVKIENIAGGIAVGSKILYLNFPTNEAGLAAFKATGVTILPVALVAALGWGISTYIENREDKRTMKHLNRHIKETNEEAALFQRLINHDIPDVLNKYKDNPEQCIRAMDKIILQLDDLIAPLPHRQNYAL